MIKNDETAKLTKDVERVRRESIRKETEKFLSDNEYLGYFNYIVSEDDVFCGVLFWDPRNSDPQYITLGDPHLGDPLLVGEIEVYYEILQNCINIINDYENEITGEYARQC